MPLEHRVSTEIHQKSPKGFAEGILRTKIINFKDGLQGLRMDLKGLTLRSSQKARGGSFEPHLACRFVAKILDCLKSVHRAGFVHADLKPTNILFDIGDTLEEAM